MIYHLTPWKRLETSTKNHITVDHRNMSNDVMTALETLHEQRRSVSSLNPTQTYTNLRVNPSVDQVATRIVIVNSRSCH